MTIQQFIVAVFMVLNSLSSEQILLLPQARPTEVRPTSVAFLLRFPVPQIGVPYIFGKFRVQRKCLISNIFEKMDFSKGLLMGEKLWSFFKLTMILHSKSPKCGKKWI